MKTIRIDIVSDIVCPWCVIGYKRLCKALDLVQPDISADIYWHPFELNPAMPIQGQNLREHLAEKYGTTPKASEMARATLTQLGKDVGFDFHFTDSMRIYNTRQAHQLLLWAQSQNQQPALQAALFDAYFTQNQNIAEPNNLLNIAANIGLERSIAETVIQDKDWAQAVAKTEQQWLEAGITAVPAIIFAHKHLVSGAQNIEVYVQVLRELAASID
ncbi:DsbA family oxidoreductase [Vibrio rhodolitus]|uniref:DsbA family oxidoreductase n=1 Tax=Vibrio rhodolitus TaxID=2231649 RepID=UPI000E0B0827|nr:DsbA family oxidoreductase [Vibrio rhodolitus]